jgi:hypothetical protein
MGLHRRVAFIGGVYALSCLKPTELTLSLKTNVPCAQLQGIEISIGALGTSLETAEPSAVTQCVMEGDLGTLVLTPGGARDSP